MEHYKFHKNRDLIKFLLLVLALIFILWITSLYSEEIKIDLPSNQVTIENDVRDYVYYSALLNQKAAIIFDLPFHQDSVYAIDIEVIAKQDSMPNESAILAIEFDNQIAKMKINSTIFENFFQTIEGVNSKKIAFRFDNAAYLGSGQYQDRNLYIDKIALTYRNTGAIISNDTREITIKWDPNTENDLAGYMVYYGHGSGDYQYRIETKYNQRALLTDPNKKYYFAVTAYDTANNESGYSQEVFLAAETKEYYPGDINKDLSVDSKDFFIILAYLGQVAPQYDIDGDNKVTSVEFFNFLADLGKKGYKKE